jgi:tripartite-type tricarboxylate transporter receptor subunit TctC
MSGKFIACGAALAAALLAGGAAAAQTYKGKTVTMIINYPAGGPADIDGRLVARHLARHIPGKPRIIVKNLGGGGGMIGTNYLGEVARPDGMTMGFFTWNVIAALLGDPGLRVRYTDFAMISGLQNPLVFYMRRDTPPGIDTAADIMKAKGFKALSLSAVSTNTIHQALALDILGVSYQKVAGYRGLKDVQTAILQNEGQLTNTSLPGWTASVAPTMGRKGIVLPLWQLNAAGADGALRRSPAVPDIATFEEVYRTVHGRAPSGVSYDALRLLVDTLTSMFRTTFMPPGAAKAAVNDMRAAFDALAQDKAFIGDYRKAVKIPPSLVSGADGEIKLQKLATVRPEIRTEIARYTGMMRK